jgi:hypothetical protein
VARVTQGPMADAAKAALDTLMSRKDEAKKRLGSDDPSLLARVMSDFMDALLDEWFQTEEDFIRNDKINKIIDILVLDDNNSIILYELDNDKIKQDKILELIPDIRKYFSFTSVIGASEPDKAKRPYLSIIRQITKSKYNMLSCDYRIKEEGKEDIRTKKYLFIEK